MVDDSVSAEFLASFKGLIDHALAQAPTAEPPLRARLREHFGDDLQRLPILTETFELADRPNLQRAIDAYVAASGRSVELLGLSNQNQHMGLKLVHLTEQTPPSWGRTEVAPVEYANLMLDDEVLLPCVERGLYLVRDAATPLALLLQGPLEHGWQPSVTLEVMAPTREEADTVLTAIRRAAREHNVYRGQIISIEAARSGYEVTFHHLPPITRAQIILPAGTLERIERATVHAARHADALRAAGRHLKRGLLLYGPPGTGKTLSAMYLAQHLPGRTTFLMTGSTLGMLEQTCALARLLAPATVILEDVDLIAEERTQQGTGTNALLFELLNQMDGLAEDVDVLFVLTTNRPEILEPALAARPGRVDQAVLIPLPDADCRQRLFARYSQGMDTRLDDLERWVAQTEGVSAAFIKELLRTAALLAADERLPIVVEDRHIEAGIEELLRAGGELTRQLLGAAHAGADGRHRLDCA